MYWRNILLLEIVNSGKASFIRLVGIAQRPFKTTDFVSFLGGIDAKRRHDIQNNDTQHNDTFWYQYLVFYLKPFPL
jgi:hypothetical protein